MLNHLKTKTIIALSCFILAKFFGFLAMIGLVVAGKHSHHNWMPIVFGSLWGILIILSIVISILSWYDSTEDKEKTEYERLRKKFG